MDMKRFLKIVNEVLESKGYPIDIQDLPDVDFYEYFDDDFSEDDARKGAEELVGMLIYDGDLPEFD
jgi:hypothetical protein